MQRIWIIGLAAFIGILVACNSTNSPRKERDAQGQAAAFTTEAAQSSGPQVIERGIHHRVWDRPLPDGTHATFTELQSGLYYEENGQWLETQEEITGGVEGPEALKGPHKVRFPATITDRPVEVTTPDGKIIRTKIVGIAYFDPVSDKSIMIGELRASSAELLPSRKELLYQGAFSDLSADVRYTYRRAGLEQDVIFRASPPPPSRFGLSDQTSRLSVITEFIGDAGPTIRHRVLATSKNAQGNALCVVDDIVDFDTMHIAAGRAFQLGEANRANRSALPIFKTWSENGGRKYLFEEMSYATAKPDLEKLRAEVLRNGEPQNQKPAVALQELLGSLRVAQAVKRLVCSPLDRRVFYCPQTVRFPWCL